MEIRPGRKVMTVISIVVLTAFFVWYFFAPVDYYEYEAGSAAECLPGEQYNEDYNVCYFDFFCESEAECAEIDEDFDKVLDALADDFIQDRQAAAQYNDMPPLFGSHSDDRGGQVEYLELEQEQTLVKYDIKKGILAHPEFQTDFPDQYESYRNDEAQHEALWKMVRTLFPDDLVLKVNEFIIMTDGFDGTSAYVEMIQGKTDSWSLAIDPVDVFKDDGAYYDLSDTVHTLIHEFAHIISLDSTQIEIYPELVFAAEDDFDTVFSEASDKCPTDRFFTIEGCLYGDSYLNKFYQDYWADIYNERDEIEYIEDDDDYYDALDDFYQAYKDRFVTDYAATNPGEDIAESFTLFVLRDDFAEGSIADQKVSSFANYPELAALREMLRSRIPDVLSAGK